jgi:hypothetical protein
LRGVQGGRCWCRRLPWRRLARDKVGQKQSLLVLRLLLRVLARLLVPRLVRLLRKLLLRLGLCARWLHPASLFWRLWHRGRCYFQRPHRTPSLAILLE